MGFWMVVSPWVAPFLGISIVWSSVFSGVVVVVCSLWLLFGEKPKA